MKNYDDIICMPHHVSRTRRHMSAHDRAAQFAPFVALTGFGDVIDGEKRITSRRPDVADDMLELMDGCMAEGMQVEIEYFKEDERKSGGEIVRIVGNVKRIRREEGCIRMEDGTVIRTADIIGLKDYDTT